VNVVCWQETEEPDDSTFAEVDGGDGAAPAGAEAVTEVADSGADDRGIHSAANVQEMGEESCRKDDDDKADDREDHEIDDDDDDDDDDDGETEADAAEDAMQQQ